MDEPGCENLFLTRLSTWLTSFKTIDLLLEAAHTQMDWSMVHGDSLLPVASQAATLRQIFLILLTAVAQAAPARIQTRISPGARLSQA